MNKFIQSLQRTPYQSLAVFFVLFFTLLFVDFVFFLISFLYGILNYVETVPQVIVYFKTAEKNEKVQEVQEKLKSSKGVKEVKLISKKEAYEIYKKDFQNEKDGADLVSLVSESIFPASLQITAEKPQYLEEIAISARKESSVDDVQYSNATVDTLIKTTNGIRNLSFFLLSFLIVMSVIVVIATTSFKVILKRDEIEILQLIGASGFFIVKPFLVEGIIIGLLSSTFSIITLYFFLQFSAKSSLSGYLQNITYLKVEYAGFSFSMWPFEFGFFILIYLLSSCFSILITTIANLIATKKYLS